MGGGGGVGDSAGDFDDMRPGGMNVLNPSYCKILQLTLKHHTLVRAQSMNFDVFYVCIH